jgi:hypothetical protein
VRLRSGLGTWDPVVGEPFGRNARAASIETQDSPGTSLLLASSLNRQSLLQPSLFARFQMEGVLLRFSDNILLLNLPFEPPQGALQGLPILNNYACQL